MNREPGTWRVQREKAPEELSVVRDSEVEQFVDDDVRSNARRGREQVAAENEPALRRAGRPLRLQGADLDAFRLNGKPFGPSAHFGAEEHATAVVQEAPAFQSRVSRSTRSTICSWPSFGSSTL